MTHTIKNRWAGEIIFSADCESQRECVEKAVAGGANLAGANLDGANLDGANLAGSNLAGSNLVRANLVRANLVRANLYGSNLAGSNLAGANLDGANLYGSNLDGANLAGAKGVDKWRSDSLRLLQFQVGKIRAFKRVLDDYGSPTSNSLGYARLYYHPGDIVEAEADEDEHEQCGAGVNLCTLDWALTDARRGCRIMLCEFEQKDLAAVPMGTDGKFRVRRCKVLREVTHEELGYDENWRVPVEEPEVAQTAKEKDA